MGVVAPREKKISLVQEGGRGLDYHNF